MSDKSKFYADQARIKRQFQEIAGRDAARRRAFPEPACACGFTAHQVDRLWAVQGKAGRTKFYCSACAPPDLLDFPLG